MKVLTTLTLALILLYSCQSPSTQTDADATNTEDTLTIENMILLEGEKHFKNIVQLTDGGDNAEAYWSFNDEMLVFQVTNENWGLECDQIFYFNHLNDDLKIMKSACCLPSSNYSDHLDNLRRLNQI